MKKQYDKPVLWTVGAVLALWFGAAVIGGVTKAFDQPGKPPLLFGLSLVLPVTGFLLAYWSSSRLRRALFTIPLSWITSIHIVRLVGVAFVIDVVNHTFPARFGMSAGLGDIISALVAIPLAVALFKERRSRSLRLRYIAWNIFGLTDLVVALTLGLLYSDSVFGVLRGELSTAALANFPINLIPTFYVPMLILLHFLGFRRSGELLPTKK